MHRLVEGLTSQPMQFHTTQSEVPTLPTARPGKWFAGILAASLTALLWVGPSASLGQESSDSQASAGNSTAPAPAKSSALVNAAGPDISLQNSEALFDIAVALNSCGYDQGLGSSDPIRQQVREQVNVALQGSADARQVHE